MSWQETGGPRCLRVEPEPNNLSFVHLTLPSQAKDIHFKAPEVAPYPRFIRASKRIKPGIAERVNKMEKSRPFSLVLLTR